MPPPQNKDMKSDLEEVLKVNAKAAVLQAQNAEQFADIIDHIEASIASFKELKVSNDGLNNQISRLVMMIERTIEDIKKSSGSFADVFSLLAEYKKTLDSVSNYLYYHIQVTEKNINSIDSSVDAMQHTFDNMAKESIKKIETVQNTASDTMKDIKLFKDLLFLEVDMIKTNMKLLEDMIKGANSHLGAIDKTVQTIEAYKSKLLWIMGSGIFTGAINILIAAIQAFFGAHPSH